MREEEMEFLGMSRKKKAPQDLLRDPEGKMVRTQKERREVRMSHLAQYNDARDVIMDEIEGNQGTDIMEQMLKERREWVNEQRQLNMGKAPTDMKEFYNRFNTAAPKKDGEEEPEEDGKKDKKKKKGEKKKKGKGKKGKGDGEEKTEVIKIGPTEIITKFEE